MEQVNISFYFPFQEPLPFSSALSKPPRWKLWTSFYQWEVSLEILIFYRTTDNMDYHVMDYHVQDNFFKGNSEKQQLSQDEF